MVRQLDNIYRLDHAVTANQKVILKAFGLDANSIKYFASELSKELKKAEADVILNDSKVLSLLKIVKFAFDLTRKPNNYTKQSDLL